MDSESHLEDLDLGLDLENTAAADRKVYIRVTNTNTGEVERVMIDVDASTDTIESIAAKINAAATGRLTASAVRPCLLSPFVVSSRTFI